MWNLIHLCSCFIGFATTSHLHFGEQLLYFYEYIYRVSQKFVPLISSAVTFDQKFILA